MNKLAFTIIFLFTVSSALMAQQFSEKKVLIDNLGAMLDPNGVIKAQDVVYCKIMNGELHFLSHIGGQLNLYKYENGEVVDLGHIGSLGGFIVDVFDHNNNGLTDILGSSQIKLALSELTFEDGTPVANQSIAGSIYRAGDYNNNGVVDILTRESRLVGGSFVDFIHVYFLNENNDIDSTISFSSDRNIGGVQAFDHNNNGYMDFAYLDGSFGDNRLIIQTNNGDGTFEEQVIGVSNVGSLIVAADINNDSNLDILITGFSDASIDIIRNENGSFSDPTRLITTTRSVFSIQLADMNNNGNLDIVYLFNRDFQTLDVMMAKGLGDGTFDTPELVGQVEFKGATFSNVANHVSENWISICDYNDNGNLDILVNAILEDQFVVFENEGEASSINENASDESIYVYPNPSSHELHIKSPTVPPLIEIIDTKGRMVSQTKKSTRIDISFLKNGFYFLNIHNQNGGVTTVKFMKTDF